MVAEAAQAQGVFQALFGKLTDAFLAPGAVLWAPTLLSALLIAAASLAWPRLRAGRGLRPAALARALLPRRIWAGASGRADLGLFLFNTFPAAALFGWMIASSAQISGASAHALAWAFGPPEALPMAGWLVQAIVTATLFLAYEFAYWLDHYLSHRVPALWEFHKVHHTAEALSPLTVYRVHPIDSLVFANIVAIVVGVTGGALNHVFGGSLSPTTLFGTNVLMTVFLFATIHLQHSHVWISFTGAAGRVLMSPAHHQIHHSADPIHFNKNFGSCLSVCDWAFGTLHVPGRRRERLRFGAALREGAASAHSVTGTLIAPFTESARAVGAGLAGTRARLARLGAPDLRGAAPVDR